jgi:hypothetical protein
MAINIIMPSINNFLNSFSNGLPGMKDYRHASRLYLDDNFKLLPKQKFLFHTVFSIDNTIPFRAFTNNEQLELNMLVKNADLPKFDMNLEEKQQYNKKTYIGTKISYAPVTITFHDDHADTVNAFWKAYYEYNIADSLTAEFGLNGNNTKDNMYDPPSDGLVTQYGRDGAQKRKKPFLKNIEIFCLHKQRFTSFTLVNPVIGSWSHDNLDQTDGQGIMQNTMQIFYETVLYGAGLVKNNGVPGFAKIHYDLEPSPLSVLGGGTTSIFGPGGIVDGIGSVISDVQRGEFSVATILRGINTYNNAKKIKAKDAVKEEIKGIVKEGVIDFGKQAGTITNPVGNFSVGSAAVANVATVAALATAKGYIDSNNATNTNVVATANVSYGDFLTPTEATTLVTTNEIAKDKVASALYYQQVGSRNNITIAESDIAYAALSNIAKDVYRNQVNTKVNNLVATGYLKISRNTQNVSITAEKVNV